jgi:hypothetical protein
LTFTCLIFTTPFVHAQPNSVPAAELDPDAAIEWVNTVYDRIFADSVGAPAAARLYGYTAVTLYESVLPGMPDNQDLAGQLNGLTEVPQPSEDGEYDWDAVTDAAMLTVLSSLFESSADSVREFNTLYNLHLAARESATSEEVVARSTAYGEELGQALVEWISSDGFAERVMDYEIPDDDPSTWVMTAEGARAVEPGWGSIRPLVLENPEVCDIPNDVSFSTDEDSVFYTQANEVMIVGENLTQEQKDIAEYWIDTPGQSGTPAGHWVHIAQDLIEQEGLMLDRATELYLMTGVGVMDSFIATWNYKYRFPLIRPVSYINEYINPRWRTYLQTPQFPEYPSGHSVVSGTVATIMTNYFGGPRAFSNENITPSGMRERSFTSFWAAANEAAISRMYGGIHYRAAIENGLEMGRDLGNYISDHIQLRQGE